MNQIPILILSDSPDQTSGLARIARDLATLLASTPEFRVGTLGVGGRGAQAFPWMQYQLYAGEFGEQSLPAVWEDFSQGEPGIVFTIFDLCRILWLARPELAPVELRSWLEEKRRTSFKLWSYVPVDSMSVGGKLTGMAKECLLGIDRVLAYSPFGEQVIRRTIGKEESDKRGVSWLPHPLNLRIFCQKEATSEPGDTSITNGIPVRIDNLSDRSVVSEARTETKEVVRIGCVMTNQHRKDFGLWAAIASELVNRLKGEVRFWVHVDTPIREWSLPALIEDYQLGSYVEMTTASMCGDEWLADQYRKCNLTILPSLGEGTGYPIFESVACEVPCLHGDYAGGASLMTAFGLGGYLVPVQAWRLEGQQNCLRPVYDPKDWVDKIITFGEVEPVNPISQQVAHLAMPKLGKTWQKWFREGVGR